MKLTTKLRDSTRKAEHKYRTSALMTAYLKLNFLPTVVIVNEARKAVTKMVNDNICINKEPAQHHHQTQL